MNGLKNKIRNREKDNLKIQRGFNSVIKLKEFRKLWISQIFSQLADKFYIVLMIYIIAEFIIPANKQGIEGIIQAVPNSFILDEQEVTLLATGIYISNTIPAIIFGAIAGIGADYWPKCKIMELSNTFRGLLTLLIPICIINGNNFLGINWGYFGLLVITFLVSSFTQFFAPAEQSTIPIIVPKENLLAANSLYQATSMGTLIIGFSLGEPLINLFKKLFLIFDLAGGEFILLPMFYFSAAIIIKKIQLQEKEKLSFPKNIRNEIIEGIHTIKERNSIKEAIIKIVFLYSLLATLYVITITLASSIQSLGTTKFGSLLAISGLGIVIGAIGLGQIGEIFNIKKITSIGLGGITFTLVFLGKAKGSLFLTLLLCFYLGINIALIAIPAQTTIHRDTPESQRGRVFGLQNNLINIALTIPLVLAGGLIAWIGLNPLLWILAGVAFLAMLLEKA